MTTAALAIDIMGGDHGIDHNLKAVRKFLTANPNAQVILVGDTNLISAEFSENPQITLIHAPDSILMDDSPVEALRIKKQSSMRVAIDLVKTGKASAMLTAGNTGAIVALAKLCIGMQDGIKRPVLAAEGLDCNGRSRLFLDLGANVDCTAKMLHQFAILGSQCFQNLHSNVTAPKVALFNVGKEQVKGSVIIKDAVALLEQDANINYIGFVEGDSIVESHADVIVVDGFTGNIALKSVEGTIKCMLGKQSIARDLILCIFKKLVKRRIALMPGPAAILLGIRLPVFKVHGSASQRLFLSALNLAYKSVEEANN